jgi:predicted ATPase/DNA-binding CsgD family transcriptional regulator
MTTPSEFRRHAPAVGAAAGVADRDACDRNVVEVSGTVPPMHGADPAQPSDAAASAEVHRVRARHELVGRQAEVAAVLELLTRPGVQVITVTGLSGVGKSALLEEVVAQLVMSEPLGVQRVALDDGTSALEHPGLTDALWGTTLLVPTLGPPPTGRRRIVHLDGCEGTVGLSEAVAVAIERDKGLVVLASSLHPIGVQGECVVTLRPLATMRSRQVGADGSVSPAAELIRERVGRARADQAWSAADATAAERLGVLLDGLPLALELAARRCRVMSLAEVADLIERSSVLGSLSDPRAASSRRADLRSAMEWSFELLDPSTQRVLLGLAVAVGGCDWDAAVALAAGVVEAEDALAPPLSSLVDSGFVHVDEDLASSRYRLPAAVREFALELLEGRGELAAARDRHAAYFLELGERSGATSCSPAWHSTWTPLAPDLPNFTAAIEHLTATGRIEPAIRLSTELLPLWRTSAHSVTGAELLSDLLADADGHLDAELSARALAALAELWTWARLRTGSQREPHGYLESAAVAAEVAGTDRARLAVADAAIPVHLFSLAPVEAVSAAAEGLVVAEQLPSRWWQARLLSWQAVATHQGGDPAGALVLATEALRVAQGIDDRYQILRTCMVVLGLPDAINAPLPPADELVRAAIDLGAELEEGLLRALLAGAATEPAVAGGHLRRTMELGRRTGLWFLEEVACAVTVMLSDRFTDAAVAAELSGGLDSRWPLIQLQMAPGHREWYEESVEAARRSLGDAQFAALRTKGAVQGWPATLATCSASLTAMCEPAQNPVDRLTERERDVLAQIARGLTNKGIAQELGLRPKTVAHHVANILHKLGVSTRTEAAVVAMNDLRPD